MRISARANELLPRLYAAACGEAEWTEFLKLLAESTGADAAHVLCVSDMQPGSQNKTGTARRQWIRHIGLSEDLLKLLAGMGQMDPWLSGLAFGRFSEGWADRDSEIVPREEVVNTDYFQIICKPYDLTHAIGAVLLKRPGEIAVLGLLRGEMAGQFEDSAVDLVRELAPHLASAVRVYSRVADLKDTLESLDAALHQFAIGVVALDRQCRVVFANSTAEQQLRRYESLVSEQGGIRTVVGNVSSALQDSFAQAIAAGESPRPGHNMGVVALQHKGGSALHVFAIPWLSRRCVSLVRPAAILLLTEPERRLPRETWIQALYGLTAAEARLAVLIATGIDGPTAAQSLGLSAETVRTRLKTIFNKTDTKRQSDLARLLATLPQG